MAEISTSRLKDILQRTVGPTPWYWKTFAAFSSVAGQRFTWTHHGSEGPLGYVVTLALQQEPDKPRLALNTYCRPFFVPPTYLGIWCPEGRSIRITCFDPDQLKAFELIEIAGWFKPSSERIYSAAAPLAEFEISLGLPAGMNKIEVPPELQTVDELIVPTSYPAKGADDPAFALYVVYPNAGLVEVLPQKWLRPVNTRSGSNGLHALHAIPSRIAFLVSVLAAAVFCWRKMGAGWNDGWIEFRTESARGEWQ